MASKASGEETKVNFAYQVLRNRILSGDLTPGRALDQTTLSLEIGVSRTPLRQALGRLTIEGLVEAEPHKTARVAPVDRHEMIGLYFARKQIEPILAEAAAPNLTDQLLEELARSIDQQQLAMERHDYLTFVTLDAEFHAMMYRPSGFTGVFEAWKLLRGQSDRYISMFVAHYASSGDSISEHRRFLDLISSGDGHVLLRHAVEQHVSRGLETLLALPEGG